jgi:hypothetical protein
MKQLLQQEQQKPYNGFSLFPCCASKGNKNQNKQISTEIETHTVELRLVVLVYFAILLSRKSEGAMTGEVVLHVYDVTNSESGRTNSAIRRLNKILRDGMGIGGIFHGAIQVTHHSYANSFSFFFFFLVAKTQQIWQKTHS